MTKKSPWEESLLLNRLSLLVYVTVKTRLLLFAMFYSSLHFAMVNGNYWNIILKPKQVKCLEAIYSGRDTVGVLPTGYGKSIIFHLLPRLFFDKISSKSSSSSLLNAVVVVVSPLNSLISDQIRRSTEGNIKATVLKVGKSKNSANLELDYSETDATLLKDARYDLVFTHPESVLSCKQGLELFQSLPYQRSVQAVVVDEAHCILEWGDDFRTDYANLAMLCATFPKVPVVALTATASRQDIEVIKQSLNLKNPIEVIGNPNRPNIFYKKVFHKGDDTEFFKKLLEPIACDLKEKKVTYPTTIMYLPLRWCGFAFKYFEKQLGDEQYHPSRAEAKPENRLFAQYHAPQTAAMKEHILKELSTPASKIRVIFATVAMGMGVDIPAIRHVIHVGPPCTVREYFQETGRAGRDGKQSFATLYYNNRDIAKNRVGLSDDIRKFCCLEDNCLRGYLLKSLDAIDTKCIGHLCCSYCESVCDCDECLLKSCHVNCLP